MPRGSTIHGATDAGFDLSLKTERFRVRVPGRETAPVGSTPTGRPSGSWRCCGVGSSWACRALGRSERNTEKHDA